MASGPTEPVIVARVGELRPGQTKKFLLPCGPSEVEAFVVNHRGSLRAYINRCRHVPMTMDWVENQFLTEDGAYILCSTHGACFRPDTGECVDGPPLGKFLIPVPLDIADGLVRARCPASELAASAPPRP